MNHAIKVKYATIATNAQIVMHNVKIAIKIAKVTNVDAMQLAIAMNAKVEKIVVHVKLAKNVLIASHVIAAIAPTVKTVQLNVNLAIVLVVND